MNLTLDDHWNYAIFKEGTEMIITEGEAKIAHQGFVAYDNGDRRSHREKQCTNNTQLEARHLSHFFCQSIFSG